MIRVGLTELHGISEEIAKFPPKGVKYSLINPIKTPPFTGHLKYYKSNKYDLLEATVFPMITQNKWIYTPANFEAAAAFDLFGTYPSRKFRLEIIKRILLKDNFKKLIFKSFAGKSTLKSYGKIKDKKILNKTAVVYPAVRRIDDSLLKKKNKDTINILFPGPNFLRKGGINVVDAFEKLQKKYDNIKLIMTAHFPGFNKELEQKYSNKIKNNSSIKMSLVKREDMFSKIYPKADIFILPTYYETFGYSIVEAMAFGLPIISAKHFAIPEIVEENKNAFLIKTSQFSFIKKNKNYTTNFIPKKFSDYLTKQLYSNLSRLIEDTILRKRMASHSLRIARTKFSFEKRNRIMKEIYEEAKF
ncbi:glycosyltransferase family 4 protein [Candidatus Woesearchaeota archaeon]|nr:glycosyltransferase family 4 protein [Candidatus Woesearchaeota archaeon]